MRRARDGGLRPGRDSAACESGLLRCYFARQVIVRATHEARRVPGSRGWRDSADREFGGTQRLLDEWDRSTAVVRRGVDEARALPGTDRGRRAAGVRRRLAAAARHRGRGLRRCARRTPSRSTARARWSSAPAPVRRRRCARRSRALRGSGCSTSRASIRRSEATRESRMKSIPPRRCSCAGASRGLSERPHPLLLGATF